MNRKQISNFLDSIIPKVKFNFRYGTNLTCCNSPAACESNSIIWINTDMFFNYSSIEQKGILLHEVGHILSLNIKNPVNAEYTAQLLALQIAKSKGWKRIFNDLDNMISNWATDYSWNYQKGLFRRYILAGRKYNENKINGKTPKI